MLVPAFETPPALPLPAGGAMGGETLPPPPPPQAGNANRKATKNNRDRE
jgi:hypothetical protein